MTTGLVMSLECPCCGCEGAVADADGLFYDGQPLVCPCDGHVAVYEDDGDAWVSVQAPCTRCQPEEAK